MKITILASLVRSKQFSMLLFLRLCAIHLRQLLVVPPALAHRLLSLAEKILSGRGIALLKDAIPALGIDVVLQRKARILRVELKSVLSLQGAAWIVAIERPIRGVNSHLLLIHAFRHIDSVGDAMTVSDDQGWPVVRFGFDERLQRLSIVGSHRDLSHVDVAVPYRHQSEVLLRSRFSARRKLCHRAKRRRLGSLSARV